MSIDVDAPAVAPAWKKFQNDVARLFRIAGYDVSQDVPIDFKKVDVMIAERRLGKVHRTAVECKLWNKTTTQKEVTEIYANYLPLIPKSVDELLIVSKEKGTSAR